MSYENMYFPKRIFEGGFSSYVRTGVQFRHFRKIKMRFLHIA